MPIALKKRVKRTNRAALHRAAAKLKPPSGETLTPERAELGARIERLFERGTPKRKELAAILDKRARAKAPPGLPTLGGEIPLPSPSTTLTPLASFLSLLRTLHVPTNSPMPQLPKYVFGVGRGDNGYGSGSKETGHLSAVSHVSLSSPEATTFGVVYSEVKTDPKDFGQVSLVTFDPAITWSASGKLAIKTPFSQNLDGTVRVLGIIWLLVYEINVPTSAFELVRSKAHVVFDERLFGGSGEAPIAAAGAFAPGSIPLPVIVDPAKLYWFGVQAQVQASQNLDLHGTSPNPPPGQFNCFGVLTVDVPSMSIDHVVLAR